MTTDPPRCEWVAGQQPLPHMPPEGVLFDVPGDADRLIRPTRHGNGAGTGRDKRQVEQLPPLPV
jgi:hypothetical protein